MRFVYLFFCFALLFIMCEDNKEAIVGSPNHDVRLDESRELGVIADGVSTLAIKAIVTDLSGLPADNQQVYFSCTLGEITHLATTDQKGVAIAEIRSIAGEQDIISTVTATVLDSASRLYKSTPLLLQLAIDETQNDNISLSKINAAQKNTVEIDVVFRGLTIDLALEDSLLSADGISFTPLHVHVFETTNKQPVPHKLIKAVCFKGKIEGSLYTGEQGTTTLKVFSAKEETTDSVQVSVGNTLTKTIGLRYVHPNLKISAKENMILADGRSSTEITATLLTMKNTPIQGANINFSTTAGVIEERAVTDKNGNATVSLVSADEEYENVKIKAAFYQLVDSVMVAFVLQGDGDLQIAASSNKVLRDGRSTVDFQISLGSGENAAADEKIQLSSNVGEVPTSVTTNDKGFATFAFIPDAGIENANATIVAQWNDKQVTFDLTLIGIDIYAKVLQDTLPADGTTATSVQVHLKEAETGVPIVGYPVSFGVKQGRIMRDAVTNQEGVVTQTYTAGDVAGQTALSVFVGELTVTRSVFLVDIYPSQIRIDTETNYIWVRETGEIEQTTISAKIVGISGEPINKVYDIAFRIVQGPGGGETLQAPSGYESNEIIVSSNQGLATVKLRSGIRSGAVQVSAALVSMPQIRAQTSQIVIRSGPPYMWISPLDHNNVIQHGTLIVQPGKHNIMFTNPVQDIQVSAIFTDKYNNPVEQGTAVYFTTTGGLVSSDAMTNDLGQAVVTLKNVNPFPYLQTSDAHQLTATNFPDPNSDGTRLLDIEIPDFERGQILNSIGDTGMNDGVATILAITNGRDQFNQNIKVYVYGHVVYSVGLYRFKVWADKYTLQPGEATTIYIEVFDHNGNPVASGSRLTAKTDKGKIAVENLMNETESYGWGSTFFTTALINNEESSETGTEIAVVEVELDSPNGDAVATLSFTLIVPKKEE